MGVVYKARQRALNRVVALKMIKAGQATAADLLTEARAVARLQHPNIIQVFEVGELDGQAYFAQEFVDGGSLDRTLRGEPQDSQQAARDIETLAGAMHAAHQQLIVHRDLKPANILRTRAGVLKIGDFGLAKQLDSDLKTTQAVKGTPCYMAPEQATAAPVTPATDVYALGAILYEMLTGRPPFKGKDVWDTLDQVRHLEPVPPRQLQPKVPRDLETICLQCLRKEPARRYNTAAALADDLRRFQHGEPILARRVGLWERGVKYARRKPWVVAAVLAGSAAALFLVAGSGYYLYRQNLDLEAELSSQKELADTRVRARPGAASARSWTP